MYKLDHILTGYKHQRKVFFQIDGIPWPTNGTKKQGDFTRLLYV